MKRGPPFGPALRRMIWPLSPEDFLARCFGRRHFASHGGARRVAPLLDALGARTVTEYLRRRTEKVHVWYETMEREHEVVEVPPADAAGLYRAGLTLYIPDVGELAEWKEALGRQLGFERGGGASLFAARRGGGTRWHFDQLENFTVQLAGTKTWRVARNRQVPLPLENWVTRDPITEPMRVYVPGPLPWDTPPEEVSTVRLRAGSMLYLPRGHWHTAEASSGDSLSVTFLFGPQTWESRLLPGLRDSLISLPAWREHAGELFGDLQDEARARTKIEQRLAELRDAVAALQAEDFLPPAGGRARVGPATALRRNPLAFLSVGPGPRRGTRLVQLSIQEARPRRLELEIEAALEPVCLFVAQTRGRFPATAAAARARRLPFRRVAALLETLCEAGMIRREGRV